MDIWVNWAQQQSIASHYCYIFQDKASHSRTAVFTLIVTRELEKWEDCKNGEGSSTKTQALMLCILLVFLRHHEIIPSLYL